MKLTNEYAHALDDRFYRTIPKAVLAAIAVSYASEGGDNLADAQERVREEWGILYDNGIVPQKPPAKVPTQCAWFVGCQNAADGIVVHPILGDVPTCQRCTDKLGLDLVKR